MDANKILTADVLDILFEGKNKEYGAYNLRKTYGSRIRTAITITGASIAIILLAAYLSGRASSDVVAKDKITDVDLSEVKKIPPPPPPPKNVLPPPPVQQATVKFTPPVIKKDQDVPKDVKPPDQKTLDKAVASDVTTKGAPVDAGVVSPPVTPPGTGVVAAPVEDNTVFTKVEVDAKAPGNWANYLGSHLNGSVATDNGASPGTYRVLVQFIVSKDGSVSDVHALTNFGSGMEEEAVRAIKNGPKWTPAQQNGRIVNAYRIQPILFEVDE